MPDSEDTGMSCSIHDGRNAAGYREIRLENGLISLTVLPERGAEVSSLLNLKQDLDVLWKAPWGMHRQNSAETETLWMDGYAGGWQEIIPNGGDPCVYKGALLGFHGEASVSSWECSLEQGSGTWIAAEFSVRLARTPFELRRRMIIEDNVPAVRIEEQLTNAGEEEIDYMWGHHPAYGAPFLSGDCELVTPAATYLTHGDELKPERWPGSQMVSPPEQRVTTMGYLADLSDGWYEMRNGRFGLGVRWEWDTAQFPYIWVWRELSGSFGYPWYGRCYVMGVEPFSSIPGSGLTNAIAHGTAKRIAAGATIETKLRVSFTEGK